VIEQWYSLNLESGPRPALVLDVSESAQKIAPYLRSLTEGVLELMPPSSQPRIFFLGNSQPHQPDQFAIQIDNWFRQNAGRGSFIGPVFEALADAPDAVVAVAGAGPIFDLPDWRGHPLAEHAVWMKVGPMGVTEGAYQEDTYTCEQLAERLNNPMVRVEISGQGVMPILWDDAAFRIEANRLVGAKNAGSLRFGVLMPELATVTASVVMANGVRRELPLALNEELPQPDWMKMPHGEFMLLRQCLNKNRFQCPICQQEHAAGALRCQSKPELPLFPTLESMRGGFVLIDSGSWETRLRPHPCPVLALSSETVAIRDAAGAKIMRYDAARDDWRISGSFTLFHRLEDKRYAMVL
jgi:hypothetical protein